MKEMENLKKITSKFMSDIDEIIGTKKKDELPKYTMFLSVDDDDCLSISVKGVSHGNEFEEIGYITEKGECHFVNNISFAEIHNEWLENGRLVDQGSVIWKGEEYSIRDYILMSGDDQWHIYDFEILEAMGDCCDKNIVVTKESSKPILF